MTEWRKSSYSNTGAQCVEVRGHEYCADIRDTKHRNVGYLTFPVDEWRSFLQDLRADRF